MSMVSIFNLVRRLHQILRFSMENLFLYLSIHRSKDRSIVSSLGVHPEAYLKLRLLVKRAPKP